MNNIVQTKKSSNVDVMMQVSSKKVIAFQGLFLLLGSLIGMGIGAALILNY